MPDYALIARNLHVCAAQAEAKPWPEYSKDRRTGEAAKAVAVGMYRRAAEGAEGRDGAWIANGGEAG